MPYDKITSLTNPRIKSVVQLRDRKKRLQDGLTIIEGTREMTRALESGVVFKELYVSGQMIADPIVGKIVSLKASVYEVTKSVFSKIAYGNHSEGVLAVCSSKALSFKDLSSKVRPLFVVVESVEKPGNLGAILRTCDGAGVDGVIICDEKIDIYNPNVIRASLGTVFSVKVVVSSNEETLKFLKSKKVQVCATLPEAKMIYSNAELTDSLAIVAGSEEAGLTDFWVDHADKKVKIPMKGRADSLNVSASTAIVLYEAIRQRSN